MIYKKFRSCLLCKKMVENLLSVSDPLRSNLLELYHAQKVSVNINSWKAKIAPHFRGILIFLILYIIQWTQWLLSPSYMLFAEHYSMNAMALMSHPHSLRQMTYLPLKQVKGVVSHIQSPHLCAFLFLSCKNKKYCFFYCCFFAVFWPINISDYM